MSGLWEEVETRRQAALQAGKLIRWETGESLLEESGVTFLVREARNLARKRLDAATGNPGNPFLPYDQDLYVRDASKTHVVLLNKFNVLEHHLLVITRHFESQQTVLTGDDFQAWCDCLAERESLGFFNGGAAAGASQAHKHVQILPLPLSPRTAPLPIAPLLDRGTPLPFLFGQRRLNRPPDAIRWAAQAEEAYRDLLRELGIAISAEGVIARPYNLLLTWDRLVVVPRARERFRTVSVNALGFAGSFFVRNEEEAGWLRQAGPLRVLQEVAEPGKRL